MPPQLHLRGGGCGGSKAAGEDKKKVKEVAFPSANGTADCASLSGSLYKGPKACVHIGHDGATNTAKIEILPEGTKPSKKKAVQVRKDKKGEISV